MTQAAARPRLASIETVKSLLCGQIEALCADLLPDGKRVGAEWFAGSNRSKGNFKVRLTGGNAGAWMDYSDGAKGDVLSLIALVRFGGDVRRALEWARRWLGLDAGDPAALETVQRAAQAAASRRADEAAAEAAQKQAAAFRIWMAAQASLAGTPVEYYLAGRGIDLAALGRQPRALRFHPSLWCEEAKTRLPAMVAAVSGPADKMVAVHRTWLEQAGPSDWRKARLENPKMTLGPIRGGAIRLWRGASGKAWAAMPDPTVLDITEGIEDGLSVAQAVPEARVIAAISLGNTSAIELPEAVRTVRFWRQRDTAPEAIRAAQAAIEGWMKQGREVLIPPMPEGVKDVNELLTRGGAA